MERPAPDSDVDILVVLRPGVVPSADQRALAWETVRGDAEHSVMIADVFTYQTCHAAGGAGVADRPPQEPRLAG